MCQTVSRRAFSLVFGAAVVSMAAGCTKGEERAVSGRPAGDSAAVSVADGGLRSERFGFLVDLQRCTGCGNCSDACRKRNGLEDGDPDRRWIVPYRNSHRNDAYLPMACLHCEDPACARVCPAQAVFRQDDGRVVMDGERCLGCKYCFQACPYGAPRYTAQRMDKCDGCAQAGVAVGEEPFCVRACPFGALRFGSLDDLSAAKGAQGRPPVLLGEEGNPSYYVLGEKA